MRRQGSRLMIFWLFGIALNLIFVQSVPAFILNGQDWTGQTLPMGEDYVIDTGFSSDERNHIQAAAATWSQVSNNFDFTYGGTVTGVSIPAEDGVNQIKWSSLSGNVLALTTYWYSGGTGQIYEVDCEFNQNFSWSTASPTPYSDTDLQTVMLHEFGHYLALGHSDPPAVMQLTIPAGTQRRSLEADDVNGLKAIYPPEDPVDPPEGWGGEPPPASVVGNGRQTRQSSDIINYLLILAVPVGALWLFWRRRL